MRSTLELTTARIRAWIAGRRTARRLRAQLPLVVSVLAAYVRAGRSLRQAVADAAGEVPEPSARALRDAAAAVALGASPAEALSALGADTDVTHLRAVVDMQTRAGGDLALLLDRFAAVLRGREELRRAAAVATAQARATGRMVTAMPVFGVGCALVARPRDQHVSERGEGDRQCERRPPQRAPDHEHESRAVQQPERSDAEHRHGRHHPAGRAGLRGRDRRRPSQLLPPAQDIRKPIEQQREVAAGACLHLDHRPEVSHIRVCAKCAEGLGRRRAESDGRRRVAQRSSARLGHLAGRIGDGLTQRPAGPDICGQHRDDERQLGPQPAGGAPPGDPRPDPRSRQLKGAAHLASTSRPRSSSSRGRSLDPSSRPSIRRTTRAPSAVRTRWTTTSTAAWHLLPHCRVRQVEPRHQRHRLDPPERVARSSSRGPS